MFSAEHIATLVAELEPQLIRLTQELVRIPSYTGQEEQIARFLAATMVELDYDEVTIDAYGSVIGRIGDGPQKILFDGHIDTVTVSDPEAWHVPPFSGEILEDKLYGRGASDMKAAVASMVFAGHVIKKLGLAEGKTIYISTSTLEEDYDGEALHHICERVRPDLAVICEPSNNTVVLGQKGRAVLRIDVPGASAHGSAPEKGVNAVYKAAAIITRIEALGQRLIALGGCEGSLALTRIDSEAVSLNAIPTCCSLYLDRRLVPGQDLTYIQLEMAELLSGSDATWEVHEVTGVAWTGAEVRLHSFLPAWEIAVDHSVTQSFMKVYLELFEAEPALRRWDFSTNGVATAELGITTIGFGPGDDKLAHMRDEHVRVADLAEAVRFYARVVEELSV